MERKTFEMIFPVLKQEIESKDEKIWQTRNWSILLAGGVAGLCINFLFLSPDIKKGILFIDTYNICSLIISGASLINLFMYFVIYFKIKGNIDIGSYLWHMEESCGFNDGWEHFVYNKTSKYPFFNENLVDIQFFLSILYFIASFGLIHITKFTLLLLSCCVSCFFFMIIIGYFALRINKYRKNALISTEKLLNSISTPSDNQISKENI